MTDREKTVVTAYTGIFMLPEHKIHLYFEYLEEIMGRRISIYDLQYKKVSDEIKERSKQEFLEICRREEKSDGRKR